MQWGTLQREIHFLRINKGYMPHIIPTSRKLFSGRLNSFSIGISIIMTTPKTQKAHNALCNPAVGQEENHLQIFAEKNLPIRSTKGMQSFKLTLNAYVAKTTFYQTICRNARPICKGS